ncbi:MAG: substrate-binding domain-containing protein [Acidobacteriota bacterium]|nr:substrate-binding domain-containing protein [Acidobacteriota bacterium]
MGRRPVVCALALVLGLAGCNRDTRKKIAVIPKGQAHLFWQSVHAGANAAAREAKVEIIWKGPASETDFNGQLQIVDGMINQRVDAIVVAPIDKTAMVSVVDRATAQGIPVIIFDSPVDTRNFVAQVATDNYQAGQMAAARIDKILGGKGEIAIVAVEVGAASTMAREAGFEEAIHKNSPGIRILDKRYGNADFAQSMAVAENMLTAYPSLKAFFASNESSSVGAVRAIKSRKSAVKLVGFDSSPALLEDLKAGLIDSLIVQDPFRMGHDSVASAVEKIRGGSPEKIQNLPPRVVTRENLADPEIQKVLSPDLDKYLK